MNKNIDYWDENFNLLGVAAAFSYEFTLKTGKQFVGRLDLIIYDRNDRSKVFKTLPDVFFLDGWLPSKTKNRKSEYDFALTVPDVFIINKKLIEQMNNTVTFLELNVNIKNENEMEVSVVDII